MKLPVFYAFARSGGTLVNRCLGCISGNLVLSEVNPHAAVLSIQQQAQDWLNLLTAAQVSEFSQRSYGSQIAYLSTLAHEKGQHLVIRDWTSVNFLRHAVLEHAVVSSLVLEQALYLLQYGFTVCPVVITRRAADVYESLTRTFEHLHNLTAEEFGYFYLTYAEAVLEYPIVHYEDICVRPEESIHQICNLLEINYEPAFIHNFSKFTHCTGDNSLSKPSRGIQLEVITPLKSHFDSPFYIAASSDQNCQKADKLFNYIS